MKYAVISLIVLYCSMASAQQKVDSVWQTYYEKSGYRETPRYDQTLEYGRRLAGASPWVRMLSFGKTPEGRDMAFFVVSRDQAFDPGKAARTGKAILLVQCGIHAGEIDGKDATLMLIRDMVITKTRASLLDHVILLVIPVFNVDGHERFGRFNRINQNGPEEMGWRVTSQNLNLNRDYTKADTPEMQAWLRLFNLWLPDFFIDCHVTDGADYQHIVTYGIEDHDNAAEPVRAWLKKYYDPVIDTLTTDGVPAAPYISLRDDRDPLKGMEGGVASPRLSTPYVALQNRAALLVETHMLKPYKERVDGTYTIIVRTMEVLNRNYRSLKEAVRAADLAMAKGSRAPFPIQFETADTANKTFRYLGYRQTNEPSPVSGGTKIVYTREPFSAEIPYYDSVRVTKSIVPPVAYVIPQQWTEVINRLRLHGLKIQRLVSPVELTVEEYRLSDVRWQQQSYEGRHTVRYSVQKFTERRTYPAGTAIVRINQRAAGVVISTLEPEAPDAFLAWGFFDACLEQKEYSEGYVMEPIAAAMLAKDSTLKREFEKKVQSDTSFAKNPYARLNFFYQRTPYWDSNYDLYPVARMIEDKVLPTKE